MAIIALHSASTGLSALSTSLDIVANNLANANTDGFKASRANFQDLLYIERAQPDVMFLMPCGFSLERTRRELVALSEVPAWRSLPAVRDRHVYLVDGPAYFNRSGPRLVDGVELLAGLLHPTCCEELIPCGSVESVEVATGA
ncbi:MAG: hypothetical protein IH891_02065 [Planctomycetes bacterium]|nr:hypothetical protein [Planctomycetota bacterium]